jgi:hypothetical protein
MGLKSSSRGLWKYTLSLDNLRGWNSRAQKFFDNDGLKAAAVMLRDQAFRVLQASYKSTKKGWDRKPQKSYSYLVNGRRYPVMNRSLEDVLFSKKPPVEAMSRKQGYTIRVVNDYENTIQQYPHLLWQEKGIRGKTHRQAYIRSQGSDNLPRLLNLREEKAKVLEQKQRKTRANYLNRYGKSRSVKLGEVTRRTVVHPRIAPRRFIQTATTWLKLDGRIAAVHFVSMALKNKR